MLRLRGRKMDARLPDATARYIRPNALTRTCPLSALSPIVETPEFRLGRQDQCFWLLLKPQSSDIVFENGVIEWTVPTSVAIDEVTLTLLDHAVDDFKKGHDSTPVRVYRELPVSWWIDLGFYALADAFDLPGVDGVRLWLKPMLPQVEIPTGLTETTALRSLTRERIQHLMHAKSICCEHCGRSADLAIGALDAEGRPIIVCRQVGCLDE